MFAHLGDNRDSGKLEAGQPRVERLRLSRIAPGRWVKPRSDRRLADHMSLDVLTRIFPPEVIDDVLTECGRIERRNRLLPARMKVYPVLALFSSGSYGKVVRAPVAGREGVSGWPHQWSIPTKAPLFQARKRLGAEPSTTDREKHPAREGRHRGERVEHTRGDPQASLTHTATPSSGDRSC